MIKVPLSMGKIKCYVANESVPKILQLPHCFSPSIQARETDSQRNMKLCSQLALPSRVLKEFQAVMFTAVET